MRHVLKLLAKSILISLGLTVAASAADVGIQKTIFRSGTTTFQMKKWKRSWK